MAFDSRRNALFIAGLMGLAGVASAAGAAHGAAEDARLLSAASALCLAHAPALVALAAAWDRLRTAALAALLMAVGTALFAGDMTMRHMAGHGLFPMAAPAGGFAIMAGWLAVSIGGLLPSPKA
ncbi:hypothetical protein BJF93_23370 [Xaviernesmea oryzae]|uniref:DUF423 domain-containing protein n=1 Tax=Xaviernesmea oryzae TaxID=464029 RepID=A0A1Q9B2R5_9HYPH|nr:DUF423 domain-containing protein [Xaviernesmea oryzae]OLP62306.1 hypothetical protein BJF93_23370 [Xaviernesmea oryzae]SEL96248.1 Uncharacterized membrane protein YgdD, TMEM256/DUF423 family [Xaviernesmea oryzae]